MTLPNMIPNQCIETVTVHDVAPHVEKATLTTFDAHVAHNRFMTLVSLEPGLAPSRYQATIIVYADSTRRRHVTTVDYDVKLTPRQYAETEYVRPTCAERTFGAVIHYYKGEQHRWYETSLSYDSGSDVDGRNSRTQYSSLQMYTDQDGRLLDANHNTQEAAGVITLDEPDGGITLDANHNNQSKYQDMYINDDGSVVNGGFDMDNGGSRPGTAGSQPGTAESRPDTAGSNVSSHLSPASSRLSQLSSSQVSGGHVTTSDMHADEDTSGNEILGTDLSRPSTPYAINPDYAYRSGPYIYDTTENGADSLDAPNRRSRRSLRTLRHEAVRLSRVQSGLQNGHVTDSTDEETEVEYRYMNEDETYRAEMNDNILSAL